jgi:REP element-mobilizing transposase RayT
MPSGPRLDAPGILHHVMVRGIGRAAIFISDADREDFLSRLDAACADGAAAVYAWCLMDNHLHLAIRAGGRPLATTMRRLLTGYAIGLNRRHDRVGPLFQNRYKSVVVESEGGQSIPFDTFPQKFSQTSNASIRRAARFMK